MTQLEKLIVLLGTPDVSEFVLQYCLDKASDIICDIRFSDVVETKYLNAQLAIAIEIFSKMGAEGQTAHAENGINRSYESADISPSLLNTITPVARTPYSTVRVVNV